MDARSLIGEPCRARNCAEQSLESLVRQWQEARALLDRHGDAVADPEPVGAAPPYPAPAAPAAQAALAALAPLSEISATATVSMNHSKGVFVGGAVEGEFDADVARVTLRGTGCPVAL